MDGVLASGSGGRGILMGGLDGEGDHFYEPIDRSWIRRTSKEKATNDCTSGERGCRREVCVRSDFAAGDPILEDLRKGAVSVGHEWIERCAQVWRPLPLCGEGSKQFDHGCRFRDGEELIEEFLEIGSQTARVDGFQGRRRL